MAHWSLDEEVVLFAWLDFCNKHKQDYFTKVEQVLEKNTGISRTKAGIYYHLRDAERRYREPDRKDRVCRGKLKPIKCIMEMGSKGLIHPPKEWTKKIEVRLSSLEKLSTSKTNDQDQLDAQVPPRKSPRTETRILPPSVFRKRPQDETYQPRKRRLQEDGEEIANKKRCLRKNTASTQLDTKGKTSEIGNSQPKPAFTSERTKSHISNEELPTKATTSNVLKEPRISHPPKVPSADRENPETIAEKVRNEIRMEKLESMQARYKQNLQIKEAEINDIRKQWDDDTRTMHASIGKLQQTKLDLEAKVSNLEAAALDVKNAGGNPLAYEIGLKNIEIYNLTNKIHQQFGVSATKFTEAKYLSPLVVDTALNELRLELEAMTQTQDFARILGSKEWFDDDLEYLVNSAFATPQGSIEGKVKLRTLGGILGPTAVVSILAITALRDWVFLKDFPRVELGSLSLIESYRNIAFNKGGWGELRCFDFGAFKEHMKHPYFKEVLNRTARHLACRLSRILSFIFSKSLETVGTDFSFHTWGEDVENWKERQAHYEKLFNNALELKSSSVCTEATYTFEFSSNQVYLNKPFGDSDVPEGSWLCLSISAYKSRPDLCQSEKESALVHTRNFLPSTTDDWTCDYRKKVYFGINQSHQMQRISPFIRDPSNISVSSEPNYQNSEQDIFQSEESPVSEGHNNHFPIVKISNQTQNVSRSPAQQSDTSSIYFCKACNERFGTHSGLQSHEKRQTCRQCNICKKSWPTIDELKQHTKKYHKRSIKNPYSSLPVTGDCIASQAGMTPIPKRRTRSIATPEGAINVANNLGSYTNPSKDMRGREANNPRIPQTRKPLAGKNKQAPSKIFDSVETEDEETPELPESPNSPPPLAPILETDNHSRSTIKGKPSIISFDTASEEPEFDDLEMAGRSQTAENIRETSYELGEQIVEESGKSIHRNLQGSARLRSPFGPNQETGDTSSEEEDTARNLCTNGNRKTLGNSGTPDSSTNDMNTEKQTELSSLEWDSAEEDYITPIVFNGPKLIPERRASQLNLVNTENKQAEYNQVDENKDIGNINTDNYERTNTAEDESIEQENMECRKTKVYKSMEADHDHLNTTPDIKNDEVADEDINEDIDVGGVKSNEDFDAADTESNEDAYLTVGGGMAGAENDDTIEVSVSPRTEAEIDEFDSSSTSDSECVVDEIMNEAGPDQLQRLSLCSYESWGRNSDSEIKDAPSPPTVIKRQNAAEIFPGNSNDPEEVPEEPRRAMHHDDSKANRRLSSPSDIQNEVFRGHSKQHGAPHSLCSRIAEDSSESPIGFVPSMDGIQLVNQRSPSPENKSNFPLPTIELEDGEDRAEGFQFSPAIQRRAIPYHRLSNESDEASNDEANKDRGNVMGRNKTTGVGTVEETADDRDGAMTDEVEEGQTFQDTNSAQVGDHDKFLRAREDYVSRKWQYHDEAQKYGWESGFQKRSILESFRNIAGAPLVMMTRQHGKIDMQSKANEDIDVEKDAVSLIRTESVEDGE